MTWAAVAVGGASLVSGYMGSKGADDQLDFMEEQLAFQKKLFEENKTNFKPYMESGTTALNQYQAQLGLGGEPAFDVTQIPGYQNALKQGIGAVNQGGAGAGMLMSGERLKGLQSTGQNIFGDYYNNYMNRLSGLQEQGFNAASNLSNVQGNMSAQMGQTRSAMGDASAAKWNAIGQGVGGMMGAGAGMMGGGGGGMPTSGYGPQRSGYSGATGGGGLSALAMMGM
jgi:hypothetical protein